MRYLSLFSGIEACTQAWHPLGWKPVGFAEIDPFPCAVLAHHYPDTPNLGSVTDITDEQIASLGPIDLVVGGSPCQDLSVAGKRKGLEGERSGLFSEQMRIFDAARRLCGARWLLWENVPGAFSTNQGRDFAVVVGDMAGSRLCVPRNGWKTAGAALGENGLVEWAVLDAQWFGVPQRRRRVFALLDTGDWRSRPPILLEPESVSGDSPPRREAGEIVAPTVSAGAPFSRTGNERVEAQALVAIPSHDPACTLTAREYKGALPEADLSTVVSFHPTQDPISSTDACHSLGANKSATAAVAFDMRGREGGAMLEGPHDTANIRAASGGSSRSYVVQKIAVRRLTPLECSRLQGFPDDYLSQVRYLGRTPPADGAIYKALGNSIAVPCLVWIARRIMERDFYENA